MGFMGGAEKVGSSADTAFAWAETGQSNSFWHADMTIRPLFAGGIRRPPVPTIERDQKLPKPLS
jgi:hypothetical protein